VAQRFERPSVTGDVQNALVGNRAGALEILGLVEAQGPEDGRQFPAINAKNGVAGSDGHG